MAKSFYDYFKENMEELGLPAPHSLFTTQSAALATAKAILDALKVVGGASSTVTVGEIIGATTGLEALTVVAGLSASFYVGAVIGSIAVAAGKCLSDLVAVSNPSVTNNPNISQVMAFASRNNLNIPGLEYILTAHPEILNSGIIDRRKSAIRVA